MLKKAALRALKQTSRLTQNALPKSQSNALPVIPVAQKSASPSSAGPTSASLISPLADALLIGGASILTYLLYLLFVDKTASTLTISYTAAALAFIVNGPHFMSSYQLMYGDYRHLIREKRSYFWAAVIAPALLIGALIVTFTLRSHAMIAFMIQGMYLSVGWHYVKQNFGTAIVTSAAQKRYFSKWERTAILGNLYAVWAMSWLSSNIDGAKGDMYGVGYFSLALPPMALTISYYVTGITLIIAVAMCVRKWIETGVWPSAAALVSFASIYVWFLPVLGHPSFFYLIPFFHSLQYMLFVVAMKWNQSKSLAIQTGSPRDGRASMVRSIIGFFGLAGILGYIVFNGAPDWLDSHMGLQGLLMGPTMWAFAITWFVNVHHYFIDNVIWRNDNPLVREHLVVAAMNRPANRSPERAV